MTEPRTSSGRAIHVLFVCLGNICRSPMAEAVFRHMVDAAGLSQYIRVDSAGTGGWHIGEPPHHGTRHALQRRRIPIAHAARVISSADFAQFDYVIALDRTNLRDIRQISGNSATRVALLLEYAPQLAMSDVPDPYFTGQFDEVYDVIAQACHGLLEQIIRTHHLPAKL